MDSKLEQFRVVDHGVKDFQSFHGVSAMFTELDNAIYGIGDSAKEAGEDALKTIAKLVRDATWTSKDWTWLREEITSLSAVRTTPADIPDDEEESEFEQVEGLYHHVEIQYTIA